MEVSSERIPYISILIITYNYAKELLRALDSISRQTYKNFEVVIVDDCSTDNTVSTVNQYIKEHSNLDIRLIKHSQNFGIVTARNTALDAARGEYCYMHDADDWMDDDCLKVLSTKALESGADRVIAEFRDVDINGNILQVRKLAKNPSPWLCMMHDGCLYKRKTIVENRIRYEEGCWDDLVFNFIFSCRCGSASFIHRPVFNYYVNPKSTSGSSSMRESTDITRFKHLINLYERETVGLDNENLMYAQYFVIKYYYAAILQEGREMKYRMLINKYNELHALMKESIPSYLKNGNIRFFHCNGERPYGRRIVFMMTFLERVRLYKLAIWGYLILSKMFYFRT